MKKILAVLPPVARVVGGGVATQAVRTVEEVSKLGIEVVPHNPWEEYNWEEFGAAHIFCGNHDTLNMTKTLKEKGIPIILSSVFFHSHPNWLIKAELKVSSLFRKVVRGFYTAFDYFKENGDIADIVLPNTSDELEKLAATGLVTPEKLQVIPNGVDLRFKEASPDLFYENYGEGEMILSVANLGFKRKNMLSLIKALQKIETRSFLIGPLYNNSYGKSCIEEIEKAPQIRWLGPMDNDSPILASAYAASTVFALPSYYETPGIASMEAALAGATVVSTPYGGTKEYFGDKAYYAEPKSINSITETIEKALSSPKPELGTHISNEYSWEAVGKKTAAVYRRFL